MKIATARTGNGRTNAVLIEGDLVRPTAYPDVRAFLAADGVQRQRAPLGDPVPLNSVTLAPVVPRPEKVVCLGLNFVTHIAEMGRTPPAYPTFFAKFARCLIGPRDPIICSPVIEQADWEAELAVVVGHSIRDATPEQARRAIGGYTVFNDVSARDWQFRTEQWLQGKAFEGSTPVGPWLVTPDEVDHAADLRITCSVDGTIMQDGRTSDLLFRPESALSYLSQVVTLVPGDVVSLGTPSGTGYGQDPKQFLMPDQIVRTEIEGIGVLENRFERRSST